MSRVYEKRGTLRKLTYLEPTCMHIIMRFIPVMLALQWEIKTDGFTLGVTTRMITINGEVLWSMK